MPLDAADAASVVVVVDLFCGIGGFSEGARQAGASVALAVDSWRAALDAHASRHPEAEHWCEELGGDVAEFAGRVRAAVPTGCRLHLHGSPHCQQLSSLNPGGDRVEGMRLVTWYLDVVDALRPHSWTMEQVPHPAVLRLLTERRAPFGVLRFDEFGAPNARRRVIAGTVDFDALPRREAPPAARVLAGLEDMAGGFTRLTGRRVDVAGGGGYVSRSLDLVSSTVTRRFPCLYDPEARRSKMLRPRSLLALQSFPRGYLDAAAPGTEDARLMIGNAVSPALARALMTAVCGGERAIM